MSWCSECRSDAHVVDDPREGVSICTKCGAACGRLLDDSAEWRNFEGSEDHSRVGFHRRIGMPEKLDLGILVGDRHGLESGQTRAFTDARVQVDMICERLDRNAHREVCYEIFGIVRRCTEVIHELPCLLAAVLYQSCLLKHCPIPINILCAKERLDKASVLEKLRHVRDVLRNTQSNAAAADVLAARAPENGVYVHLLVNSDLDVFLSAFQKTFGVQRTRRSMMNLIKALYLKRFPDSHRSAETVSAGIIYHVLRADAESTVRLADISGAFGISDSSITSMTKQLPQCPGLKRKH